MSTGPELSAILTRLAELTRSVTDIADGLTGTERDAWAAELYEVERSLLAATRRLEKVVDELT